VHTLAAILASVEGEKSETPYFIAGGLFAVWAIVVSFIGLRRPDFPKTKGAGRATIGVSVVLAASTLGLLIAVSA
jgi:hypothetical protein